MDFAPEPAGTIRVDPNGDEGQVSETGSDIERYFPRENTGDASSSGVPWAPSRGVLRLSRFDAGGCAANPQLHRSVYVNGPDYGGMKDNDVRGFLDGGFIWGWNQSTQIHVRFGRTGEYSNPKYGENELFRVLQRWDGISLPTTLELSACRLTLHVEEGPPRPLRLLVYAVARDWNPGSGGVDGNNVSVPEPGEVWWGDSAYEQAPWGHPGAGFASDSHPEADTKAHALAEAAWSPGDFRVVFQSDALTRHAAERIRQGKPLLLLLKLTDAQEDIPGCFFNLYSGEHGDSRNTVRRPRLELEWCSPAETESIAHDVFLEYGRSYELPRQSAGSGLWMASFEAVHGYATPGIQVREGTGDDAGPWHRASFPFKPEGDWFQLRLLAMPDPVELGNRFEAELADTWILTGPPERQSVPWFFESPSGISHKIEAEHVGRHRWCVQFVPDELGTWRYHWTQTFLPEPYRSARGEFHVWGGSFELVMHHLERLEEALEVMSREARDRFRPRLYSLEREGMRLLTPEEFRGAAGKEFRAAIRRIRSSFWGKPVPESIPMQSHRLIGEFDGVELSNPILDSSRYGPGREEGRSERKRNRGLLRRVRRLAVRLTGRRGTSA